MELWVEESSDRELYFQRGANLSVGGLYLERTIPHPRGVVVSLRFSLPGDPTPFVVRGRIVNVEDDERALGMGIKFLDLSPADTLRLQAYVERAAVKPAP
ncbi:MAG: PilZ domain-containing protein [Deltaproteobacteria bacterium]|nr:PilZ domain-containing protein [Deltaproteobacteria bacterium]